MNPVEIRQIAEAMRDCGIVHLKMHDFEMSCQASSPASAPKGPAVIPTNPTSLPQALSSEQTEDIKHKVENLASLLKLDDNQLIDQLFPEPKNPEFTEEG